MYSGGLRDETSIWNFACNSSLRLERETKKHKPETKVMKIFLGGYFLVKFISRQVL
jgi:hypothetical protein